MNTFFNLNKYVMKMNRISSLCLAATLSLVTACTAGEYAYNDWDYNNNAYLDDSEFDSALSDIGYYDEWDEDNDTYVSENEWDDGVDNYLDGYDSSEYGTFSDWDADSDGTLDDGEFNDGLYSVVDENDNDLIEENEYDIWYDGDFGV